jgi:3-hydroxy-5-phosphonooxypentane-2,4-dione thiolase
MDWGKANRMSRLFQEDGKCFYLPIDHGYFLGPTSKLERPEETIAPIKQYCDALFVTRGILRSSIDPVGSLPIILRVSGGTSISRRDELSDEIITTSIEEVLRVNADAVGVSLFVGTEHQKQTLGNLTSLVNDCEKYGIPVMAVTAVGNELEKREARYLALCARIFAELGASVVKTYWCKDFEKITEGCPVPVVIAGGPKCETTREVLEFVYDGLQRGAAGINLGRNVWQAPHPAGVARALQAIIHEGADVDEAEAIFNEMTNS